MDTRDISTILVTALCNAVEAVFAACEAAVCSVLRGLMALMLWVGIIGTGLIFVMNTVGYEMAAPGASLELSRNSFVALLAVWYLRSLYLWVITEPDQARA